MSAAIAPVSITPLPQWDDALVKKYDVAGPRYTSYPTAPHFTAQFGSEDYAALWRDRDSNAPLSLYVHIPFCENICYYCACNKIVTRHKEKARSYLNYLEKEVRLQAAIIGGGRPVTQLHWGGGTPTFLSGAEMTELMYHLASHFTLLDSDDREYSIEVDPRTVDRDALALLKGLGFNRLSFGIQDFDPAVQGAINRVQSIESVQTLVDTARALQFQSLSFDLIYGLPHQSTSSLRRTLARVLELRPDRIALYNYAHLPERFPTQRAIDRLALPSVDDKLAMMHCASDVLGAAGYCYIGMDHFVLPHDQLARAQQNGSLQRNFQGYSTSMAADLVGLGVSAIGSTYTGYTQNARDLETYYAALDADRLPLERGALLRDDDLLRRHVIMQIICNLRLDIAETERRFAIAWPVYFREELLILDELAADGLITIDATELRVAGYGRFLLRNICMVFDTYLQSSAAPCFSRAI